MSDVLYAPLAATSRAIAAISLAVFASSVAGASGGNTAPFTSASATPLGREPSGGLHEQSDVTQMTHAMLNAGTLILDGASPYFSSAT